MASLLPYTHQAIDKLQSLYQGRPVCLRESNTNLSMTFLDEYEELELFNSLSYTEVSSYPLSPVYTMSTFTESCKLSIILDRILRSFYTEKIETRSSDVLLQECKSLQTQLQGWQKSVPYHLILTPSNLAAKNQLPHILSLQYVKVFPQLRWNGLT